MTYRKVAAFYSNSFMDEQIDVSKNGIYDLFLPMFNRQVFFFQCTGAVFKIAKKNKNINNVLQHCDGLGIDVPRFCYHDQLYISGNRIMRIVFNSSCYRRWLHLCGLYNTQNNVLQHCDGLGIDVPRFCYHDQLYISGNRILRIVFNSSGYRRRLGLYNTQKKHLSLFITTKLHYHSTIKSISSSDIFWLKHYVRLIGDNASVGLVHIGGNIYIYNTENKIIVTVVQHRDELHVFDSNSRIACIIRHDFFEELFVLFDCIDRSLKAGFYSYTKQCTDLFCAWVGRVGRPVISSIVHSLRYMMLYSRLYIATRYIGMCYRLQYAESLAMVNSYLDNDALNYVNIWLVGETTGITSGDLPMFNLLSSIMLLLRIDMIQEACQVIDFLTSSLTERIYKKNKITHLIHMLCLVFNMGLLRVSYIDRLVIIRLVISLCNVFLSTLLLYICQWLLKIQVTGSTVHYPYEPSIYLSYLANQSILYYNEVWDLSNSEYSSALHVIILVRSSVYWPDIWLILVTRWWRVFPDMVIHNVYKFDFLNIKARLYIYHIYR